MSNTIPKISKNIDFTELDDGDILCTHLISGQRLKLNRPIYNLLQLVNGKKELEQIAQEYNLLYKDCINKETILKLFDNKIKKFGIIYTDNEEIPKRGNPNYIHLRINLIKSSTSSRFTFLLFPLFQPILFWLLSTCLLFILSFLAWTYSPYVYQYLPEISIVDIIICALLSGITLFIHEFGHITACDRLGAKHGSIGFGFYLFTPVMYADVTDIWRLPIKHRMIVNMAGIYMGNIIATIYFTIYILTNNYLLLYLFYIQFLESLYNLNPFIKYDGYWVLSDLTNIPNLHKEAYLRVFKFNNYRKKTFKDWFLTLYGIMSLMFTIIFLISILIISPESLLKFPVNIYKYITNLIMGNIVFNLSDWLPFLPPFIFYYLSIKLCYKLIKKSIKHE